MIFTIKTGNFHSPSKANYFPAVMWDAIYKAKGREFDRHTMRIAFAPNIYHPYKKLCAELFPNDRFTLDKNLEFNQFELKE